MGVGIGHSCKCVVQIDPRVIGRRQMHIFNKGKQALAARAFYWSIQSADAHLASAASAFPVSIIPHPIAITLIIDALDKSVAMIIPGAFIFARVPARVPIDACCLIAISNSIGRLPHT